MYSFTVAFSGKSSILQAYFLPEIFLDENFDYSCAMLDLIVTNENDISELHKLGVININCDIISGSYINGKRSHTIHQFDSSAANVKAHSLTEYVKHLNFFPINTKQLHSIQISFADSKGKLINFDNSDIICRIIIKRN